MVADSGLPFGSIIGMIYDTILDPRQWPEVMLHVAAYAQAYCATLAIEDVAEPEETRFHIAPEYEPIVSFYLRQGYMQINPMRLAMVDRVKTGDVVLTRDFMNRRQYQQTRFFRGFMRHFGLADIAASVLDKGSTRIAVLSLLRDSDRGPADEALRQRVADLTPHVRRAAAIGRVLDDSRMEASSMADTLDLYKGGVFLLDAEGTILHASQRGRRELEDGTVFRALEGRLTPRLATAGAALADALAATAAGDFATGGLAAGAKTGAPIVFSLGDKRNVTGTIIPLTGGARRVARDRYKAVAALFVREARFEVTAPAAGTLRTLHGLTPRETAVLVSVVENGGAAETAEILGISEQTVKTHLRAIHRKTGAARSADLVKLVGAVATPFG
jgi:DNA-binding CsgD family transcriptional regulator